MEMINLVTGSFLLLLGLAIKRYNLSYLISGYNTSSKNMKKKYEEKKLCDVVGSLIYSSSLILILPSLISIFYIPLGEKNLIASWFAFTLFILIGVIYINVKGSGKK